MKEILFDLLDRKFTVELLIKTKIGRCVRKLRSRPGGIGKLASTIVVEMKRVILADDDDETEEQETEDHEVHEQEETEVLEREETEDQDPEDQESESEVNNGQSESVNITPPPEYVIKKRTALTFPCSYCEKLFQTSLLRNVHEEENHGEETEDQDPDDQESETEVTIEQRESVNITPPPEYVIKNEQL